MADSGNPTDAGAPAIGTQALPNGNANAADSKAPAGHGKNLQKYGDAGHDHAGRQASRFVLTGLFALLGAKVTAFVATHAMMGRQMLGAAEKNLSWEQRIKKFLNFGDALGTGKEFKKNLIITGVSMAVGAVAGAVVGQLRGHRIKQPKDIIEHPIRTIKTIAISEKRYQAQAEQEYAAKQAEQEQASTQWRDGVHHSSPQRSR